MNDGADPTTSARSRGGNGRTDVRPSGDHPGSSAGFRLLLDKLDAEHGFDFRQYKEGSIQRRIRHRMVEVGVESYEAYADILDRDPGEHTKLFNAILINVTRFFRDPEAWSVLGSRVLPQIIEHARAKRSLRIWCAGCSSGEEPYTVGMIVDDLLGDAAPGYELKIYGTEIDENALQAARAALYPAEALKSIPAGFLERYFTKDGRQYRVRRELRRSMVFGRHDLTKDPPLSRIDLLICRNVLIYFEGDLQKRVCRKFEYALREGGCLFLGKAESMQAGSRGFTPVDFKWRIFERVPSSSENPVKPETAKATENPPQSREENEPMPLPNQALLESLSVAAVAVDPQDKVIAWNSQAEHLYEIPASAAVGALFRDLDISYRIDGLRSQIEEVKSHRTRRTLPRVVLVRRSGDTVSLRIVAAPVLEEGRRLAAVLVMAEDDSEASRLRDDMSRLAEQSATANEELQSTNEELETTNEELQSTNEELETTNEELQSTNEELETAVEELRAINSELTSLNDELEKRTKDFNELDVYHRSVLDAGDESVFVLDKNLVVKSWNRGATSMWGLSAADTVGQSFLALPIGNVVPQAAESMRRLIETRRRQIVPEVSYSLPGGIRGWTKLRLFPLISEKGDLDGFVGVAAPDPSSDTGESEA